jgi:D-beta-D-heptose 7-phosphate kinase/D-beta-D-heptose 1-phosphate adenosyltransferase
VKALRAKDKILTLPRLETELARARGLGQRIVFTNGCFDLLHIGHVRSLESARALGDVLIVGINLDASVRRAKGPDRPINPARARMEVVAALQCVDWVVGFAADTPIRLIKILLPDVLAKGGDWTLEAIVGREEVERAGGRVVRLPVVKGVRSTQMIERIRRPPPRRKR